MTDPRVPRLRAALGHPARARWYRAPGRVNLIGEHTDYQEGWCLPMAIDRDCLVAVSPARRVAPSPLVRAVSLEVPGEVLVATDGARVDGGGDHEPPWGAYVAAVVRVLTGRGARIPAVDAALSSTVPIGAGLSSSSAMTVALLLALADAAGLILGRLDAARLAHEAEATATGVTPGLMDQLASLDGRAGHALLVDCRTLEITPIALPRTLGVVVAHCGVSRALRDTEYALRRRACETATQRLGLRSLRDARPEQVDGDPIARHVVTENGRVHAFVAALRAGNLGRIGELASQSQASLRDDFRVSSPELDRLVGWCTDLGATGARLTGAGFGGCVVAFVQRNRTDDLVARLHLRARAETGQELLAFSVRGAAGAGPVPDDTT